MKREKLDFTDKELYYISLAFQSFFDNRDTWLSKSGVRVVNNTLKKIIDNGLKRKNSKAILQPICNFKEDFDE